MTHWAQVYLVKEYYGPNAEGVIAVFPKREDALALRDENPHRIVLAGVFYESFAHYKQGQESMMETKAGAA